MSSFLKMISEGMVPGRVIPQQQAGIAAAPSIAPLQGFAPQGTTPINQAQAMAQNVQRKAAKREGGARSATLAERLQRVTNALASGQVDEQRRAQAGMLLTKMEQLLFRIPAVQ